MKYILVIVFLFLNFSCGKGKKEINKSHAENLIEQEFLVLSGNLPVDLEDAIRDIDSDIVQIEITNDERKNTYYLRPIYDAAYLYDLTLKLHLITEFKGKILLIHFNGFNDFEVYGNETRLELIKKLMPESYQYFLDNEDFPVPSTRYFKIHRVDLLKKTFDSIPKWYCR